MSIDNKTIALIILYNSIIILAIVAINLISAIFTGTMWGLISLFLLLCIATIKKE